MTEKHDATDLARLRAALGSLPPTIDPGEDLRPGIRALRARRALRSHRTPAWRRSRPLAAAAVVVVAAGAALAVVLARSGREEPQGAAVVLALDAEYDRAGDELKAAVTAAAARLGPETAELLFADLETVETALAESRGALREDPFSPILRELVLATHRQRLNVLRRATVLAAETEEAS